LSRYPLLLDLRGFAERIQCFAKGLKSAGETYSTGGIANDFRDDVLLVVLVAAWYAVAAHGMVGVHALESCTQWQGASCASGMNPGNQSSDHGCRNSIQWLMHCVKVRAWEAETA
jgi:hypothetical protein